jgi:hypothetical protein
MASLRKRGSNFYVSYYVSGKERRLSRDTDNLQLAKEKLRRFESAQLRGDDSPLPTRTPIAQAVQAYVNHIRTKKTAKSAQTDIYYLREAFGPICPALQVTSRKLSIKARKRPLLPGAVQDLRRRPVVIEAPSFEQITVHNSRWNHHRDRTGAPRSAVAQSFYRWPGSRAIGAAVASFVADAGRRPGCLRFAKHHSAAAGPHQFSSTPVGNYFAIGCGCGDVLVQIAAATRPRTASISCLRPFTLRDTGQHGIRALSVCSPGTQPRTRSHGFQGGGAVREPQTGALLVDSPRVLSERVLRCRRDV